MTAPVNPTVAPMVLCAPPDPITPPSEPTLNPVIAMTMPAMFQGVKRSRKVHHFAQSKSAPGVEVMAAVQAESRSDGA